MNWMAKIKGILGLFWSRMFGDQDFILGVEKVASILGYSQHAILDNWYLSRIQSSKGIRQPVTPYTVYIPVDSIHPTNVDFADILDGTRALGDTDTSLGWTAASLRKIDSPNWMANHVSDASRTLISGVDYTFNGTRFNFLVNPETLGLNSMTLSDSDGNLRICYVLFGWHILTSRINDAVSGLIGDGLDDVADLAWDMHTNGATAYNVKAILAHETGSVVCKEDGAVDHVWYEQNRPCVLVGNHVYSAPAGTQCNVSHGDNVKAGQVLMGTLRSYGGLDNPPASDVPGVRVQTDAGELTAVNSTVSIPGTAYTDGAYNVLPLQGDASVVHSYISRCLSLSRKPGALFINIPDSVNAFKFINEKLRSRRCMYVSLATDRISNIEPALRCIRKSTNASAVITVFIRATGEAVNAQVKGFSASAGMIAIAESLTVKIAATRAEIGTLI